MLKHNWNDVEQAEIISDPKMRVKQTLHHWVLCFVLRLKPLSIDRNNVKIPT